MGNNQSAMFDPLPRNRMLWPVLMACMLLGAVVIAGQARADVLTDIAHLFPTSPRTYVQASALLRELDETSPLLTLASIGQSHGGRDIWLATVTDPDYSSQDKIRLFIIARQHGNEPAGTTAALGLLEHLARATSPVERALLAQFQISVVPIANPDGAVSSRRANGHNVDLNRDWGKFTQPETKAIRVAVRRRMAHAVVDLHELPAHSTKRSYQENFIETIGAHGSLPAILCDNTVAASHNISYWMSKYSYPLNVYYDYPGESLRMCHRYWGLSEGRLAFLCETKTGRGRSLGQRAGFHVLAILGIINHLGRQQSPALQAAVPELDRPAGPAEAVASSPPLETPLRRSLGLEPYSGADGPQVLVRTQVEGTAGFGFVMIKLNGTTKALTNERNGRCVLNTGNLAAGAYAISAEVYNAGGTVLVAQQATLNLPLTDLQVAE